MNLKKIKKLGVLIIFILSFISHFIYNIIPNTINSYLFPVNESIWEHMKLLFTPFVFYNVIEYLTIKHKIKINNLLFQLFIIPVISILIFLIIYIPIYLLIKENLIISITLLFMTIIMQQYLSYKLSNYKNIPYLNMIGIIGLLITIATFGYLTYHPPKSELFIDKTKNIYGIKKEYHNFNILNFQ